MIDLTREDQARKGIERLVEGYSEHEKLAIRVTGAALEITTHSEPGRYGRRRHSRHDTDGPVLTIPWTRIHRQAMEVELATLRRRDPDLDAEDREEAGL